MVDWDDLRPTIDLKPIVLPDLTNEQLRKIQEIYTLLHFEDDASKKRIDEIVAELKKENIDAEEMFKLRDEYIEQQILASETLNTELNGTNVRIPGFLVPLEFSEALIGTDFLLVPTAGACIHLPPPPANQIVRVSFPQGFELKTFQYPVWVEGKINAELATDELYIVDGIRSTTMGYSLTASTIEEYYE
jgi:hypothetical protein